MSLRFNKDQIKPLINPFVKMVKKVGIDEVDSKKISLIECLDGWVLTNSPGELELGSVYAFVPLENTEPDNLGQMKLIKVRKTFDLPECEDTEDEMDKIINLAIFLSKSLESYSMHVKSITNRSLEVRKASAKKAVEARWAKYYAEKGKQKKQSLQKQ